MIRGPCPLEADRLVTKTHKCVIQNRKCYNREKYRAPVILMRRIVIIMAKTTENMLYDRRHARSCARSGGADI